MIRSLFTMRELEKKSRTLEKSPAEVVARSGAEMRYGNDEWTMKGLQVCWSDISSAFLVPDETEYREGGQRAAHSTLTRVTNDS